MCPVCQTSVWQEESSDDQSFGLFRCIGCGCQQLVLDRVSPAALYHTYYSAGNAERYAGWFQRLWRFNRRQKAKLFLRCGTHGSTVCDVGCERGELLHVLKQSGWHVCGTQLSQPAADFARRQFGIEVFVGELPEAPFANDVFDMVTMIEVLEHLPDPEAYLAHVSRMLRAGGIFWVEVPNAGSFTAKLCGKRWLHHDPEHHFWSFTKDGVVHLLRRYGFAVERVYHLGWEYSPIGCVQSWLNFLPGPRNRVFHMVRRGFSGRPGERLLQAACVGLSLVLLPAACVVTILERCIGNGQIVLVKARKIQNHS